MVTGNSGLSPMTILALSISTMAPALSSFHSPATSVSALGSLECMSWLLEVTFSVLERTQSSRYTRLLIFHHLQTGRRSGILKLWRLTNCSMNLSLKNLYKRYSLKVILQVMAAYKVCHY